MAAPKRNTAYSFVMGLVDATNRPAFKASPTLAVGDFKVSTDGSALADLATLPVVTPAGSRLVLVSLSAAEMNGDRVVVQVADAAGGEWDEALVLIEPTVVTVEDLTLTAIADAILKRDWTAVSGEAARSLLNANRKLMNRWSIAGATLTVFKEDDTSPAFTQVVTTTPGADDAITGLDTA
jgi:hypothetical protein